MTGRGKRGVAYIQNEEPAFIRQFKERTGYREADTIDAKREELKYEDEDRSDNEDEQPTIVALKEGDLTAEDVKTIKEKDSIYTDEEPPEDGKIKFRKPVKRHSIETSDLKITSSKKVKEGDAKESSKRKEKKHSKSKRIEKTSLLSFGDEDEEENDT